MIFIDSDYKTIQLSLYMIQDDDVKTRAYRFLLPKLLTAHTEKIKTKQKMIEHLQDLYGAVLQGRTSIIGNLNIMYLSFSIVNPQIVNELVLMNDMIDLFKDMILDRSFFDDAIFETEKRLLLEQWDSLKDNKHLYANIDFGNHFFNGHPFGYPITGTKEDILKLSSQDLFDYFKEQLDNNKIYFIVNGYLNGFKDKIEASLSILEKNALKPLKLVALDDFEPKVIYEKIEMNQTLIKIGYHVPIFRKHPLYNAVLCFDLMLGAYSESVLFKEIREKQGLCYDIRSSFDPTQGILVISSGVDQKRSGKALDSIFYIMDHLTEFDFNELQLERAKQYIIHQIKSSYDEQVSLSIRAFYDDLYENHKPLEERIKDIESVTFEEVLQIRGYLKLQTTYVLSGDAHDN